MRIVPLELIRGLAAVYVVLYHLLCFTYRDEAVALLGNHVVLQFAYGREAVIIFFILSGLVNRISLDRKEWTRTGFLKSRGLRLLPLYYLVLTLSVAITFCLGVHLTAQQVLGHLFLVQSHFGHTVHVLPVNEPLWTMSAEAAFYLLAAFFVVSRSRNGLLCWLLLSIGALVISCMYDLTGWSAHICWILGWSILWQLGFLLVDLQRVIGSPPAFLAGAFIGFVPALNQLALRSHHPVDMLVAGLFVTPLLLLAIKPDVNKLTTRQWGIWTSLLCAGLLMLTFLIVQQQESLITEAKLLARVVVAAIGFQLITWKDWLSFKPMTQGVLLLGRLSFAIYLIHHPILNLCRYFKVPFLPGMLISLVGTGIAAYILDRVTAVDWKTYFQAHEETDSAIVESSGGTS